jgi:hypothetical protein
MPRHPRTVHAAALASGFLTCCRPAIRSHDWYVDIKDPQCATGNGSLVHPFCNIQEAIDAAQSGDTIHVAPGACLENLAVDPDLAIVETGGRDVAIVDGCDPGRDSGGGTCSCFGVCRALPNEARYVTTEPVTTRSSAARPRLLTRSKRPLSSTGIGTPRAALGGSSGEGSPRSPRSMSSRWWDRAILYRIRPAWLRRVVRYRSHCAAL